MGDPIRLRKKYVTPAHPWLSQRINDENKIVAQYGLKSKTELWKVEALLRKYRRLARQLIGAHGEESQKKTKILVETLVRVGLLTGASTLDDVLSLEIRDFLERRIQTVVYKKGLANSALEARQFITHGHISYKGARHTTPGTIIPKSAEEEIKYVGPVRVVQKSDAEAEPIMPEGPQASSRTSEQSEEGSETKFRLKPQAELKEELE